MKTHLNCPCGIVGVDEDQLVRNAHEHLAEVHPGRDYSADETLFGGNHLHGWQSFIAADILDCRARRA
jgi:hypothetical protein